MILYPLVFVHISITSALLLLKYIKSDFYNLFN
jgi:hypothetical protein